MNTVKLVCDLIDRPCISGVKEVFDFCEDFLGSFAVTRKNENYLKASINPHAEKQIVLEAHIDQIGMIITHVYDDGFLRAAPVGSIDTRFLPSTMVTVFGKEKVCGVFTGMPPHLKSDDSISSFDSCFIDTGRTDIGEIVSQGDFAVFNTKAEVMLNNRITGTALDNRSGVAAVMSAAQRAAQSGLDLGITVLLTMNEELGCRGAKTAAFGIKADSCISVDVSFGNCPQVEPYKTAKLGSGAMIGVSPVLSEEVYNNLKTAAKKHNVPFTLEVMGGSTSTNADVISISGSGIKCGLVSIPLRNMHTPCEVVDAADIDSVSDLLFYYLTEEQKNA